MTFDRVAYARTYYQANKEANFAASRAGRQKIVDRIREAKNVPCHDCGESYHYCVMDFDHREGEVKLFNFGHYPHSMRAVEAEMLKCDVVCSNCHRLRTWARANPSI